MTAAQVSAMLTQTLGPSKAEVQVNADVNANQATSDTLTYGKKGVPLQPADPDRDRSRAAAAPAAWPAPPATSRPTAQTAPGERLQLQEQDHQHHLRRRQDRHPRGDRARRGQQPDRVGARRQVGARLRRCPRSSAAVAGAVGLNAKRGDTLSISQIAFAKPTTTTTTAPTPNKMLGYAKYALVGLGALIFLFFMTRMLKRRERESFAGQPTWLRELETPRPLAALSRGGDDAGRSAAPVNVPRRQVEELVERDPDRVAQQVRAWMSED